jgi:hypothetical protein
MRPPWRSARSSIRGGSCLITVRESQHASAVAHAAQAEALQVAGRQELEPLQTKDAAASAFEGARREVARPQLPAAGGRLQLELRASWHSPLRSPTSLESQSNIHSSQSGRA